MGVGVSWSGIIVVATIFAAVVLILVTRNRGQKTEDQGDF